MNAMTFAKPSMRRTVLLALAAVMLVAALFAGMGHASAADINASATAGGPLGTTFVASGTGFGAAEKVTLWTTGPTGQALDAGYIYADNSGNFTLHINTIDPNALATTANYTTLIDSYNSDGTLASEYWETILKETPGVGSWHLTAYGNTSGVTKVFDFDITAQS